MPTTVTMPQLGETVVEGTILKWLKKEGEEIGLDEPLFEISTDKVDTEVPSPVAGKLQEIKVQEGETVSVGTELAVIDDGSKGEQKAEVSSEAAEEGAEPKQEPEESAEEAVAQEVAQQPEKPAEETEREMRPAARTGGVRTRGQAGPDAANGRGPRAQR